MVIKIAVYLLTYKIKLQSTYEVMVLVDLKYLQVVCSLTLSWIILLHIIQPCKIIQTKGTPTQGSNLVL